MMNIVLPYVADQQSKVKKLLAFTIAVAAGTKFVFRLCQTNPNGSARINWGDGMEEPLPYNGSGYGQYMARTYAIAGSYQIEVHADSLRSFRMTKNSAGMVKSIDYWHKDAFTAPELFINCYYATFPSIVPDGVERIRYFTFKDADTMTFISLPESLKKLDNHSFIHASKLKEVIFNGTPDHMGKNAFKYCNKLTTIKVPWSYGEVSDAPWGASNAIVEYDYAPAAN